MFETRKSVNIKKIIRHLKTNRDLQNIPVGKINRLVRRMPYPIGLVSSDKKVLVTTYLNKSTIDFFKKEADKYHTKYQRMMRAVLDRYAAFH